MIYLYFWRVIQNLARITYPLDALKRISKEKKKTLFEGLNSCLTEVHELNDPAIKKNAVVQFTR